MMIRGSILAASIVTALLIATGTMRADTEAPRTESDVLESWAKNATLGTLLAAVLWSYRRDFFRKEDDLKRQYEAEREKDEEERARLERLLERTSEALKDVAVHSATEAQIINRLVVVVERLEQTRAHADRG